MTRSEAITIVEMLVHGWPGGVWEQPRMEAYVTALLAFEAKPTTAAVLRAQSSLRYRPSIAELREFIRIEQRLQEPDEAEERRTRVPEQPGRPEWVNRWDRARANNDWRPFPEQCEYVGSSESFENREAWVQLDEYLDG